MSDYQYLDVKLKLRDPDSVTLTPVFFFGCIHSSLVSIFGEIGGQTTLDIVKFSTSQKRSSPGAREFSGSRSHSYSPDRILPGGALPFSGA
ncbi:uncharacterized protein Dere_GG27065 [Drosophila erecta]|nr:uncharacterized protein Dere_GG27065 [Drosophila erecta]